MVNLLITAGADVNAVDKYNVTVMVIAKKQCMKKIIKILGTAGAKRLHKYRLMRL
jgi:ankyrin repeat protein